MHVTAATVQSLSAKERALVAETERRALQALDEDGLVELLTRVRRARDKYVQMHRREVAERVTVAGARGTVSAAPRRSAGKAEVFEAALARVSAALAKAARTSAAELRAERIAAARRATPKAPPATVPVATDDRAAPPSKRKRQPIERKAVASARATGARRQAARDDR